MSALLCKVWRSIEVHAIYALFFNLGYSLEGLQVLQKFLDSTHDEIFHPLFLAQMVLGPINSIIEDVLLKVAQQDYQITKWTSDREKQGKLVVMFRFNLLSSMLRILHEFGSNPPFQEQKFVVANLIKSKKFGKDSMHNGGKNPLSVTGFTAAFFLTLPEFFTQWMQQKDGHGSQMPAHQILDFVGKQCLWPTFAKKATRQTNHSRQTVREVGIGSMISNAQSQTPYSFLPFDLEKLFNQCLDGTVLWKTVSLCEEPKKTQSPRKKKFQQKHAQQAATVDNDIADAELEQALQISTNEESNDDVESEEELQEKENEEGEEEEEEQAEEEKKPAADPNFEKKTKRKRKSSERMDSETSGSKKQEGTAVAQGIANEVASGEKRPRVSQELDLHNENVTNITEDFVRLMHALEVLGEDYSNANPYLKMSIKKAIRWKNYHIYSVRSPNRGRGVENGNHPDEVQEQEEQADKQAEDDAQQEEEEEDEVQEQEEQADAEHEQSEEEQAKEQAEEQTEEGKGK